MGKEDRGQDSGEDLPKPLLKRLQIQRGNEKLDLTLCSLTKIPVDGIINHFGMPPNFDLDISHNFIRNVSPYFSLRMKHLTKLDLSKNEIRRLPDNFGELNKLVYLDLHKNRLETLPLSMGNMRRLTYLCVTDNPFRAPLRDMIGKMGANISGLSMAELIVTLLQEVAKSAEVEPNHANKFPLDSRRSSKVHYRRRSSTIRDGRSGDKVSSSSSTETLADYKKTSSRSLTSPKNKPALQTFFLGLGKTLLIFAVWAVFIPIYIAYVADTSYLSHLAKAHPTFDMIWTDYNYKQIHELATPVANILPRNLDWKLKGPPSNDGAVAGFFTGIWNYIVNTVRAMWAGISN